MRHYYFLFVFVLGCSSNGEMTREPASNSGVDASKYINMLPKGMRPVAREYARMVSIEAYKSSNDYGMQNRGLSAFNWDLVQKNKCFKSLSSSFYSDVMKYEAFHSKSLKPRENTLFNNLSVSTKNTAIDSGWLWKLALRKANGNRNLAMTLIGLCGHDNVMQWPSKTIQLASGESIVVPEELPFNNSKQEAEYNKNAKEVFNSIFRNYQPKSQQALRLKETMRKAYKAKEQRRNGVSCPSIAMFRQGALGEETLLSQTLIDEIARVQAPNKGSSFLPSKYYHVMGAAYAVCTLVRGGYPGFAARKIQAIGINNYRMFRLCEAMSGRVMHERFYKGQSVSDVLKTINLHRKDKTTCIENYDPSLRWQKHKDTFECKIISEMSSVFSDPDINVSNLKAKVQRFFGEFDAARLYHGRVLKGEECKQVQLRKGNINQLEKIAKDKKGCGDISSARCKKAKDVLRTWAVDFKWSEAQHLKGADFAINNCRRESDFFEKGLEKASCAALKAENNLLEDASLNEVEK